MSGQVGPTARLLGYAGLLPMIAATALLAVGPSLGRAALAAAGAVALSYPLLILSFLGGAWWGLAMRADRAQGAGVVIAVTPTLLALALAGATLGTGQPGWGMAAIGSVIALSLIVDRGFVGNGLAPAGWMALRVPLSLGLGGLTILAGVLIGRL